MDTDTHTTRGIRQNDSGEWLAVEQERRLDDSGYLLPVHRERLLDSAWGVGAKRRMIEAAGTNAVLPPITRGVGASALVTA